MKRILRVILDYLFMGVGGTGLVTLPPGITADSSALEGLLALMQNANALSVTPSTITSAQAVSNVVTLIAAQVFAGHIIIPALAGITAGFTIQLPSTNALLAALGQATIPGNGAFGVDLRISNSSGQTGTVTAGDASTTISGTATVATAVTRQYGINVPQSTAANGLPNLLTLTNAGFWTYP